MTSRYSDDWVVDLWTEFCYPYLLSGHLLSYFQMKPKRVNLATIGLLSGGKLVLFAYSSDGCTQLSSSLLTVFFAPFLQLLQLCFALMDRFKAIKERGNCATEFLW